MHCRDCVGTYLSHHGTTLKSLDLDAAKAQNLLNDVLLPWVAKQPLHDELRRV